MCGFAYDLKFYWRKRVDGRLKMSPLKIVVFMGLILRIILVLLRLFLILTLLD